MPAPGVSWVEKIFQISQQWMHWVRRIHHGERLSDVEGLEMLFPMRTNPEAAQNIYLSIQTLSREPLASLNQSDCPGRYLQAQYRAYQ